jgi:hypothetical protein
VEVVTDMNLWLKYGYIWSLHILLFRNGYYLPGVAQVGADPGGGGGSWHEPVAQIWSQLVLIYSTVQERVLPARRGAGRG